MEHQLKLYHQGEFLARQHCLSHTQTAYFVLTGTKETLLESMRLISAYKTQYAASTFSTSDLAKLIGSTKTVTTIVVFTSSLAVDLIALGADVDQVVVCSDQALAALSFYAMCPHRAHNHLYSNQGLSMDPLRALYGMDGFSMDLGITPTMYQQTALTYRLRTHNIPQVMDAMEEEPLKKVLILAPYPFKKQECDPDAFSSLLAYGEKEGYTILTYTPTQQAPLRGTQALALPVNHLFELVKKGCVLLCGAETVEFFYENSGETTPIYVYCNVDKPEEVAYLQRKGLRAEVETKGSLVYLTPLDTAPSQGDRLTTLFAAQQTPDVDRKLQRGKELADLYCKDTRTLYLILDRHIGEVFEDLACLNGVKERYAPSQTQTQGVCYENIVVLTTKVLGSVARLFPAVDQVIECPSEHLLPLSWYSLLPERAHSTLFSNAYDWRKEATLQHLYSNSHLKTELRLPPTVGKEDRGTLLSATSIEKGRNWLLALGVTGKDVVILAPYAKSSSFLTETQCKPLLTHCKAQGKLLFTCGAPDEPPLEGTTGVSLPIDVCVALAALGVAFVFAQSGFSDCFLWMRQPMVPCITVLQVNNPLEHSLVRERGLTQRVQTQNQVTYIKWEEDKEDHPDLSHLLLEEFLKRFPT